MHGTHESVTRRRSEIRSREVAISQVVLLFIIPILLLSTGIIPIGGRLPMLTIVSLLMYGIVRKEGWTKEDFGLTLSNFRSAWPLYAVSTALAFFAVVVFASRLDRPEPHEWWMVPHFWGIFLAVSFFQEFAFRGFLMPLLGRIFRSRWTIVIVNALLFAFMHIIYPFPVLGLPVAFAGGIFFSVLYRAYPNLLLVTLSHAVLNFLIVWYGFFTVAH